MDRGRSCTRHVCWGRKAENVSSAEGETIAKEIHGELPLPTLISYIHCTIHIPARCSCIVGKGCTGSSYSLHNFAIILRCIATTSLVAIGYLHMHIRGWVLANYVIPYVQEYKVACVEVLLLVLIVCIFKTEMWHWFFCTCTMSLGHSVTKHEQQSISRQTRSQRSHPLWKMESSLS